MRKPVAAMLVAVLGILLAGAPPAAADGGPAGGDLHVAQTLGDRDLTVIIRRVDTPASPLRVDVVTHAGTPPGSLELRASTAGETVSSTTVDLGPTPGFYSGTLRVDRPGPWELAVDDGDVAGTIPFIVPATVSSPWEKTVYGGFVAAGALLLAALGLAVAGRTGLALVPAGGMTAALAVALTAGLLAPVIPDPPAPGTHLDPTYENVTDPYRRTPGTGFSRPPVNLLAGLDGDDLNLVVADGATGLPVDDLLVHDSALIHLVVVSPSGRLEHLHPVRTAPGRYHVRISSSETGTYAVAAELARRGGGVQLARASVRVTEPAAPAAPVRTGDADPATAGPDTAGPDTAGPDTAGPDTSDPDTAGLDMEVRPAGTASTITATFGAADLQPWLGMAGHMIVVGPVGGLGGAVGGPVGASGDEGPHAPADGRRNPAAAPVWAHVHAMLPSTPGVPGRPDESVAAFGPDVRFTYTFPLPGRYLAWIQTERDYSVLTVPLVIDVPPENGVQQ